MQNACWTQNLASIKFHGWVDDDNPNLKMNFESQVIMKIAFQHFEHFENDEKGENHLPRLLRLLVDRFTMVMKMMKMVKITFQDCGDCLKTGSRASARCRSSTQTQASLKGKVSEWNSRCWCWRFLLVFNPLIFLFLFWFGLLNMYAIYCVGVSSEC